MQPPETTSGPIPAVTLTDLDEAERSERFGELQQRLTAVWGVLRSGREGESIVVVPSGRSTSGMSVPRSRRPTKSGCSFSSFCCASRACA